MSDENHVETATRLALSTVQASEVIKLDDGRILAFVPRGPGMVAMENITQPHTLAPPLPTFVKQNVTLQDEGSLVLYANKFKNNDTLLFADIAADRIVAAIDYHNIPTANRPGDVQATPPGGPTSDQPKAQLLAHSAVLHMPKSEEWTTWTGVDGKLMPQLDFTRFLEENSIDVIEPDAASLIEVCRDMQALRKVNFTSIVRLNSNNAERLEYTDETKANAKGGVEIPTAFKLNIPVYFNGEPYDLLARLRWELRDGDLKLGVKLVRAEKLRQTVFKEVVGAISGATGLDVIYGKTA